MLHQSLENLLLVDFPGQKKMLNPVKHEHADTMGIGKAIAVLTSGGDAQGKWISSFSRCSPGLGFCWVPWLPEEAKSVRVVTIPVGESLRRTLVLRYFWAMR